VLRINTIEEVDLKLVTSSNYYGCLTNGYQKQLFLEPPTSQNPFKTRSLAKMIIKNTLLPAPLKSYFAKLRLEKQEPELKLF
jgi:hypothetical protein